MNDTPSDKNFWTTLPGIITAVGTLFTAVVGGIVSLYAAGVLGDGGSAAVVGAPPATTGAAAIVDQGSFPNDAEQELLTWVPPRQRETCVRGTPYPSGAEARLSCSPPGVAELRYSLFPSADAMYRHYNRRVSGFASTGDSCADGEDHEWAWADPALERKTGRAHCWVDEETGTAWIEWTADWVSVYLYASRRDGNAKALHGWWRGNSGPVDPPS